MRELIVALSLCGVLVGCAQTSPEARQQASKPIFCTAGEDCSLKWGRVLSWIKMNSRYKLRMVNHSVIATYGPTKQSPDIAYEATKIPVGNGTYQIELRGECDNLFGCLPETPTTMRAKFAAFIDEK